MKKQAKKTPSKEQTAKWKAEFVACCKVLKSASQTVVETAARALKAGISRKELQAWGEETGLNPRTVANLLTEANKLAGLSRIHGPGAKWTTQAVLLALYCARVYGSENMASRLLLSARRFLKLSDAKRKAASKVATTLPKVLIPSDHGTIKGAGRAVGSARLTAQGTLKNRAA